MTEPTRKDPQSNKEARVRQKKMADQSAQEVFELVRLRNNFYRDGYRRLIIVLLLMSAVVLLLVGIIYYMYTNRPAPKYFATNIQGQLIDLIPLESKSKITDAELLNWAVRGITAAFTINYVEWREQLQYVQDTYFTVTGSEAYLKALEDAQTLLTIQTNKLIATAQASGAPLITARGAVKEGAYQGRYYWKVKLPIQLTLQNPETLLKVNMEIETTIIRSSRFIDNKAVNIDGARGLGIETFLAQSARQLIGGKAAA